MKKAMLVCFFIMILLFVPSCEKSKYKEGSTFGNIINNGIAVEGSDGYVYYCCSGCLMRCREENGEIVFERVGDFHDYEDMDYEEQYMPCYALNYHGDYIFFISYRNKICKIRTDGTGYEIVTDTDSNGNHTFWYNIKIIDDWIYCYGQNKNGNILCKMKTDGTEMTQLKMAANPNIQDDWLYYIEDEQEYVYRFNLDTEEIQQLTEDKCYTFLVYENSVYYTSQNDCCLYRISFDKIERVKLGDQQTSFFNISDDVIYFVDFDRHNLYSKDLNGNNLKQLTDWDSKFAWSENNSKGYSIEDINIAGEWVFYSTSFEDVYRIKKDGTENKAILHEIAVLNGE